MGGSSKQVTGYRYHAFFLLFIGNPIEKVLGINFDKRGWKTPLIDEQKNPLTVGWVKEANLYGENEGGVAGQIHARYGTANPEPVSFYADHLAENDLPPIAYPYQSYLAFPDFYLGNSGYMKEMLLWPKRTRIRNDGREQWYASTAERPWVCEIGRVITNVNESASATPTPVKTFNVNYSVNWNPGHNDIKSGTVSDDIDVVHLINNKYSASVPSHAWSEYIVWIEENNPLRVTFDLQLGASKGGVVVIFSAWMSNIGQRPFDDSLFSAIFSNGVVDREHVPGTRTVTWYVDIKDARTLSAAITGDLHDDGNGYYFFGHTIQLDGFYQYDYVDDGSLESVDINPIHKIREILTDDTAMNKPESEVNDLNFMKAADRIWDEGLGISWAITEKSCLEAINELCAHIEAGVRVNRQTGLYEIVLFRDDWFEENEIHTIASNKIKSMSLEVANADEAINQLNVSYYNRETIKDSSFSVAENASIRNLNGRVNAEDVEFPYFMNQRNAAVVAQWKLKQLSTPAWKGSFTTADYNARKWNRYDLLKLTWPRKWQGEITVRIMKINLGIGTDVSIDFVEVVPYSSNLTSNIVIDEPIDVGVQPPLACQYEPFEMPYYLAVTALGQRQVDDELAYENNFGLVGVVAEKPQSNSLYAVMMTHDGTEGEEWLRAATINYVATADLDQIISRTSTSFTVKNGSNIASLPVGTLIKCGSDWIGTPGEWMVFMGIDPYTGVVSVKRGASDTLPQDWGVGTKLYFCGNDVAYDQTEYVAGEEVFVSALTTTPSGMLENKGSIGIEMKARAFRPYPPANVKINGEYWPQEIENDLIITWVDRNRLQQTGGEILGWFDAGVTIEPNTQTHLILTQLDENNLELATTNANVSGTTSYTMPISSMQADARFVKIALKTVRDGYECLNPFVHKIELSQLFSAPYDLTVEFKND